MRSAIWAGAAASVLASSATAADIAMIFGATAAPSDEIALLGDVLNARGYEVYDRQGARREDLAATLAEVAARLPEADRLILVYAGGVRAQGPRAWLVPEDFDGEGRIDATLAGLPLDLLLDMAAEVPGRAAVVIATDERQAPPAMCFLDIAAGVGAPVPPQGVLLVAGPVEAAVGVVIDGLLGEGSVAQALATAPPGVGIFGFRSPEAAFAPDASAAVAPPQQREPVARTEPLVPVDAAEAAEAALGLDQPARRRIQEHLTVLGYDARGIDGIFGPGTRGAVAQWQRDQALAGTGFMTQEQLPLLGALADARSAELAAAAERARAEEEAADAAFWRTTGAGGSGADLRAYLARYPDGVYAAEARSALDGIEAQARQAAASDDRAAWERAETENRVRGYRDYLDAFPAGAFVEQAQDRIAALRAEPDRARADEAAAAVEDSLGLGRGSRELIEGQLAALGYEVGAPDGAFDGGARRALREFQTRQGLEPTGYIDQETVQALIVASLGLR